MASPLILTIEVVGRTFNVIASSKGGADLIHIPMIRVVERVGGGEVTSYAWPDAMLQAPHGGAVIHSAKHQGGKLTVTASYLAFPRLRTKEVNAAAASPAARKRAAAPATKPRKPAAKARKPASAKAR